MTLHQLELAFFGQIDSIYGRIDEDLAELSGLQAATSTRR